MSGSLNPSALARLLGNWHAGAAPAYRELADVVRLLVLDGRVPLDTALPSERALSETLGISRTTVTAAYAHLREQGFLSSGQGSRGRTRIPRITPLGTTLVTGHGLTTSGRSSPGPSGPGPSAPGLAAPGLAAPGLAAPEGLIDLAYASMPASGEVVHRAFAAALTELPALLPGFGYDAIGLLPLREAIAERYSSVGVRTTSAQILVTSGAQHALNIVIRALAGRQDKILVEHPSYPNALDAIRVAGCRPVPVAFSQAVHGAADDAGGNPGSSSRHVYAWDMHALQTAMMQQRPRIAYVVPDFHNPTGQAMKDAQRRQLVRAAEAAGTVLVVDETLRELNLDGAVTTPVAAFGSGVVTIGSLSKSHWGGLRTGWIRASEPLIQRFAAARTSLDLGGPVMEQLAAAHLVRAMDEPLPGRLEALRRNRSALLELLHGHLPDWEAAWPSGGLSVWCKLPAPMSTALTVIAPDFGIRLAAGPRFGIGGAFERYLRVPFTLPPEQLETAVRALKSAQDKLDAAPQLRRTLKTAPAVAIA